LKFVFLYPFLVKIMLKMHQPSFGSWRSLTAPPDLTAAIWSLLLMAGEEVGGRRESPNHTFWLYSTQSTELKRD